MPNSDSILLSVRHAIGGDINGSAFDADLIMHINTVFNILQQMGIGPSTNFTIQNEESEWTDFCGEDELPMVKTYMYLKVRLLFDPPSSSFVLDSMRNQAEEMEWRMNVEQDPHWKES